MVATFHAAFLIAYWKLLAAYLHEWSNYENNTLAGLCEGGFTHPDGRICSYSFCCRPERFQVLILYSLWTLLRRVLCVSDILKLGTCFVYNGKG
jgi:hypothetical protein